MSSLQGAVKKQFPNKKIYSIGSIAIIVTIIISYHGVVAPPINSITFVATDDLTNVESLNNFKRKMNTLRKKSLVEQLLQAAIQAIQTTFTTTPNPMDTTTCSNSVVVVNMGTVGSEDFESPAPAPAPPTPAVPPSSPGIPPTSPGVPPTSPGAAGATPGGSTPTAPTSPPVVPAPVPAIITSAPSATSNPPAAPAPPINLSIGSPPPAVMTVTSGGSNSGTVIAPAGSPVTITPVTPPPPPSAVLIGAPGQAPSLPTTIVVGQAPATMTPAANYAPTYISSVPAPTYISSVPAPPTSITVGSNPGTVITSQGAPSSFTVGSNPGTVITSQGSPSTVTVAGSPSSIIIGKDPDAMIPMAVMVPRDPTPPRGPGMSMGFGTAQREPSLYPPRPATYPQTYGYAHG